MSNGAELSSILKAGGATFAQRFAGRSPAEFVQWLYLSALSRQPTAAEQEIAESAIGQDLNPESIADLVWAIIVQPEFCFVR